MGIYQSILSIGITVSSFFTKWLKNLLTNNNLDLYMHDYLIENMILLAIVIIVTILFISFNMIIKIPKSVDKDSKMVNKKPLKKGVLI